MIYSLLERQGEDPEIQGSDYAAAVEKRLRQGHVLYLGKMQDGTPGTRYAGAAFAGYTKFYLEAVRYWLALPEHCVAMYDGYTAPSRRGKRYYSQVWNAALDDCTARGVTSAWGFIMPHNKHSFIVHQKLGLAHIIQKITLRQRWGFRWHRVVKMDCYSHDLFPEIRK